MYCMCKRWGCRQENDITILSFHTCTGLLVAMVTCSRLASEDGPSSAANQWKRSRERARVCKKPQHSRNSRRRRWGRVMVRNASTVSALSHLCCQATRHEMKVLFSKMSYSQKKIQSLNLITVKASLLFLQLYQFNSVYWNVRSLANKSVVCQDLIMTNNF